MRRHAWRKARVIRVEQAASDMVALQIEPDEWIPHLAGQHYEIRFPGETLSRKFSIASAPEQTRQIDFGIQVLAKGLLSPRLAACRPGDHLEVRGPTGAAFVWRPEEGGPLVLLGGGAGITPLAGICDHYAAAGLKPPLIFIVSARSPARVFRLDRYRRRMITRYTAEEGRIDRDFLVKALAPVLDNPETKVRLCGPLGFMSAMVPLLLELGINEDGIRSEAFV